MSPTPTLLGLPYDASSSFLRGPAEAPPLIRKELWSEATNPWSEALIDLSAPGALADAGDLELPASPEARQRIEAGVERVQAGMTARELSEAVGLGDAKLLEEAEGGVATLPFEIVLRLAGVLGRNDPIPVAMSLTRQYNPELWKTLESLGVGKLAVQGARERELANDYRGNDAARQLDDEDFAEVLSFTRRAFEMAVGFRGAADQRRPR